MKTGFQLESRDRCIERHVSAYLRETGASEQSYVARVVELYSERTAPALRSHAFHVGDAGEVLTRYRALLADGAITAEDSPESLKLALESLRQLASTVQKLQHVITDTLAEQGNEHLIAPGIRGVV